jgi:hypothetical protein
MNKIALTTQLSIEDYIKVNYHLFYRRLAIKFLTGFGIFMLILIAFSFHSWTETPWFQIIIALSITIGLPLQVYFSAKKGYKTNKQISEKINYEFDQEYIRWKGESFQSNLTWNKIYNVTESKNWILIWQDSKIVNVVPKRDFTSEKLKAFKEIVNDQPGLRNKLKLK